MSQLSMIRYQFRCSMACKRILPIVWVVLSSCSKGSLYLGEDDSDYAYTTITPYVDQSPSIGLKGVYGSSYELFLGSGNGYHELLYVFPSDDQKAEKIERFIFRQEKPLNIVEIALQADLGFNPMQDAECFVKITANLAEKDFCEGSSVCLQFKELQIFSENYETCEWPRIRNFIVKLDGSRNFGYVTEPGQETWTRIEKINIDGVSSTPVRISSTDLPYSSVVAAATTDGYVVAGKLSKSDRISAGYFDLSALVGESDIQDDSVKTVVLPDSLGNPYAERAASRNSLLVATPDGFYRLNSLKTWEKLQMPVDLAVMPAGASVVRLESASGIGHAVFRFIVQEGGQEKNLVVLFNEADGSLAVIDTADLAIDEGLTEWSIEIVNSELWLWNTVAPALARKFDQTEKKWTLLNLQIPAVEATESLQRYQLTSAGNGFVLTTSYQKDVVPNIDRSTTSTVKRKVYRHFYFNVLGQYSDSYIDTYASPETLRFQDARMYAERVVGMGPFAEDRVLDYGYVYDFSAKKGRMFQDQLLSDDGSDRLAHSGGILVSERTLFFFGGCEQPVNRLCLSASPVSRLVKFKIDLTAF